MYPRLDDIVKASDVQKKGGGKFSADYVNWSRIAHYMREHAPGWQPFAAPAPDGSGFVWHAPDGTCFLMIGFRHPDPEMPDTETVPHAIMDNSMRAKKNPDARDVSDAFVRGMCKAAAMLFGLGWQLWSKDDPFGRDDPPPAAPPVQVRRQLTPDLTATLIREMETVEELEQLASEIKHSDLLDDEKAALRKQWLKRIAEVREEEE